jgi:4-hydroxybutyrate CoA-transferase
MLAGVARGGEMSDWRARYAHKIVSAEAAVALVRDGMTLHFGMVHADPWYLAPLIAQRRDDLHDVVAYGDLMRVPTLWDEPTAAERHVELRAGYLTPGPRSAYRRGRISYTPSTVFTAHRRYERDTPRPDLGFFRLSEPDEHGLMSFGTMLWDNKLALRASKTVVAEVEEGRVRSAGDNFVHVDEVDYMVEVAPPQGAATTQPPASPEESAVLDVAAAFAAELVRDGDTIEIGVGAASNAITPHLAGKHDLGYHSELTSPGVAALHERGVFTGRRKSRDVGKMVVTALPPEPADLAIAQRHFDDWEVYGVDYIHDPSVIASQAQMTAINTGTMIDLTGQFVFDSIGRQMYTGPGGQFEFVVGAVYAPGGKSIHVLPSTAGASGEHTRVVAELPAGAVVGVPRFLTDYVVTEHGVASLWGKTERDRARELIAIAHPDHRGELTAQARRLGLL